MSDTDRAVAKLFLKHPCLAKRKVEPPISRAFRHGKKVTKTRNAAVAAIQQKQGYKEILNIKSDAQKNIDKNRILHGISCIPGLNYFIMPFMARVINDKSRSHGTVDICNLYLNNIKPPAE